MIKKLSCLINPFFYLKLVSGIALALIALSVSIRICDSYGLRQNPFYASYRRFANTVVHASLSIIMPGVDAVTQKIEQKTTPYKPGVRSVSPNVILKKEENVRKNMFSLNSVGSELKGLLKITIVILILLPVSIFGYKLAKWSFNYI